MRVQVSRCQGVPVSPYRRQRLRYRLVRRRWPVRRGQHAGAPTSRKWCKGPSRGHGLANLACVAPAAARRRDEMDGALLLQRAGSGQADGTERKQRRHGPRRILLRRGFRGRANGGNWRKGQAAVRCERCRERLAPWSQGAVRRNARLFKRAMPIVAYTAGRKPHGCTATPLHPASRRIQMAFREHDLLISDNGHVAPGRERHNRSCLGGPYALVVRIGTRRQVEAIAGGPVGAVTRLYARDAFPGD